MYSNEFEKCFADFLNRHEYDEAENALFAMVRIAFSAGWQAAGGAPPQSERIYELLAALSPCALRRSGALKSPKKKRFYIDIFRNTIYICFVIRAYPTAGLGTPFTAILKWGRIHVQGTDPPVGLLHEI